MRSLRLLGDAADHDGDAVLALKRAREACALDSGNADAAKRLVAAYVAVGNKLANEAETQTKEVLSFTRIWNLEPHMRAMLEEDRRSRRTRGTFGEGRHFMGTGALEAARLFVACGGVCSLAPTLLFAFFGLLVWQAASCGCRAGTSGCL